MSIWGSVDWKDKPLAAGSETPGSWVDDMSIDVAVSCIEDRYRLNLGPEPESCPPEGWEAEVYLDRANLTKLRDQINLALTRGDEDRG
jgi:hypothetical protein